MILESGKSYAPPADFTREALLGPALHASLEERARTDRLAYWADLARENLMWRKPFTKTLTWEPPFARWFEDGTLNASEQCLEANVARGLGAKAALIWEGEPVDDKGTPKERRVLTYDGLLDAVSRFAAGLEGLGVGQGDRVVVYMPLVPEAIIAMLACARLGATHSVVFGGFSAESLRDRVNDAGARIIITADGGFRRGRVVDLLSNVRRVRDQMPGVETVVVHRRLPAGPARSPEPVSPSTVAPSAATAPSPVTPSAPGEADFDSLMGEARRPAVEVGAEHPLFILYTSGTTGKPKGVVHSTAGYMLWAKQSTRWIFDLKETDVYWCTADVGWVTGHTYVTYGPLACGATVFLYEGAPDFPDFGRFWRSVERESVSVFYTAPTAIRSFMRQGESFPRASDLSSLRLLGSVGEPINPEAWEWYRAVIGRGRCPIVDTWWQTETGGVMMTALPAVHHTKPGCATSPLPGLDVDVVDDAGASVPPGAHGKLVIRTPWPSQLRNVHGDPARYASTYWGTFSGPGGPGKDPWYFTGDGAFRDADGDVWITGRVDDVMNVSGHRLGTMEVESALVGHPSVAEAAVVGVPDPVKGTAVCAFVTLRVGARDESKEKARREALEAQLRGCVTREIGAFARPDRFRFTDALPKTRSGKIMRRLLRDVATGHEALGDTSTIEDVSVLGALRSYEEE